MTQGSYSMQQNAFAFSQVVGAGDSVNRFFTEAIREKFHRLISEYPQYLGTGWSMPWAAVYDADNPQPAADNAMIVVAGSDASGNPVLIVAVAGTNPKSALDRSEDLDVGTPEPFNGSAQIDQGTSIGLGYLEGMTSDKQTLQQYLTTKASPQTTLIFTGHSLGGALSPTLALDLFVNKGMQLNDWGAVYVMPTAGPTPGNADFASLFTTTFPFSNGWNVNVVNSLDCVPKAWNALASIPRIYVPNLDPTLQIEGLVAIFEKLLGSETSFYAALPQTQFTGTYNSAAVPPPPHSTDRTYEFAAQALYQHIVGYIEQLTPELSSFFSAPALTVADCEKLEKRLASAAAA